VQLAGNRDSKPMLQQVLIWLAMALRVTRMNAPRPRQGCSIDTVHAILEHMISPIHNKSKAGTPVQLDLQASAITFKRNEVVRDDDLRRQVEIFLKPF
jgi:hypothetical protein